MTHKRAPHHGSRTLLLLAALKQGPATFYQLCERANIEIEKAADEHAVRNMVSNMIGRNVSFDGLLYRLTDASRDPTAAGQVAGPAYRGTPYHAPVRIVRRAAGARA
ncbi:UNVERIFIED_ORG: hypothetical protein JN05_01251 [Zoogloea ramigera]|uniref:Uncharacterized protein n=1 Tax=Duganella zoogloeoides TaxID=75659 RepID=A0ABZ0Y5W2_9BURK|nr:hypothetical protein [Duganella zoogloeoides]WQH06857.1 hypothetical protein SR858_11165 [Duganella zoogloeoides]